MLKKLSETIIKNKLPFNPNIKLKPFQEFGVQWILEAFESSLAGCLLADDMGLGKTIQAITAILYRIENNKINKGDKSLIVMPKSLLYNWQSEFNKVAPTIKVYTYYENNCNIPEDADVVLTTYNSVSNNLDIFQKLTFDLIVLDEAQYIKNMKSQRSQDIRMLKSSKKLALTGTPLENRLGDVVSIFEFIKPGYLSEYHHYMTFSRMMTSAYLIKDIKDKVDKYILRRLKENTLENFPKMIIKDIYCKLTNKQKKMYKEIVPQELEIKSLIKEIGFAGIWEARLILAHPALHEIDSKPPYNFRNVYMHQSGKTLAIKGLLKKIDPNEKILIYTQSKLTQALLQKLCIKELKIETLIIHGDMNIKQRAEVIKEFEDLTLNYRILILSLKAGGVGLNLTIANNVIHFDHWYNLAVEEQASARVYRIGQSRTVNIFNLIVANTLEVKIYDLQKRKKALADLLLEKSTNTQEISSQVTNKNIINVVFDKETASLQKQNSYLNKNIKRLEEEKTFTDCNQLALSKELKDLKKQVQDLEMVNQKLNVEVQKLRQQSETLARTFHDKASKVSTMTDIIAHQYMQYWATEERNHELRLTLLEIERDLNRLHSSFGQATYNSSIIDKQYHECYGYLCKKHDELKGEVDRNNTVNIALVKNLVNNQRVWQELQDDLIAQNQKGSTMNEIS